MQPAGPAQAGNLGRRQAKRLRELRDVARDPRRVAVGGRISLVDDRRKGLERRSDLGPRRQGARMRLLHQQDERREREQVPGFVGEEHADERAGRGLAGGDDRVEARAVPGQRRSQQQRVGSEVDEGEQEDRHQVGGQGRAADMAAAHLERQASRDDRGGSEARPQVDRRPGRLVQAADDQDRPAADQGRRPRADGEDGGYLHGHGEAERQVVGAVGAERVGHPLHELGQERDGGEDGDHRARVRRRLRGGDEQQPEPEADRRASGVEPRPHCSCIGRRPPRPEAAVDCGECLDQRESSRSAASARSGRT